MKDFDAEAILPRALARRLSPVQHWAIAAADQALARPESLGRTRERPMRRRGTASPSSPPPDPDPSMPCRQRHAHSIDGGPRSVPLTSGDPRCARLGGGPAEPAFRFRGPGTRSVGDLRHPGRSASAKDMRRIRHGYADAVLVVGMEDCLGPVNLASNANMRALAAGFEDDPTACQPALRPGPERIRHEPGRGGDPPRIRRHRRRSRGRTCSPNSPGSAPPAMPTTRRTRIRMGEEPPRR